MLAKLDLIDRKLLYELVIDARLTYTQLGRKVNLSKQAIKERVHNLEKKGIIKQYFSLIDIHQMNYTFYRLDLRFQEVTEKKEKEIINYILKLPKVIWVSEIHGKWDLAIVFLTKDLIEIDDNIRKIKWKFNKFIRDQAFSVATTHSRYPYGFIKNSEKESIEIFMGRELNQQKLSDTESKVLAILSKEARKPITEISKEINKSISSVKNAIKNLKKKKILLGYTTLIDLQKLGYFHYKLFINFQNPTKDKEKKLEYFFRIHPNIIFMTKSLGRSDIECELVVKSINEFRTIVREMKREFNDILKDIETYMVLNQYVTNYYPV